MKLNIACPTTGCQKVIEIEDEKKLRAFYEKRISQEVEGEVLGPDFAGYTFKISGGNDKQGFPMMQGVMLHHRTRLLLQKGSKCYRPRKVGERKRKSVRGCIVSHDLAVLNLVVIKQGEKVIEGLTDEKSAKPRRLGPKRANKIKKLFNLGKNDDPRAGIIRRKIVRDGKKDYFKAPKIQRLITPERLQRKLKWKAEKRQRWEKSKAAAKEYNDLVTLRNKEERERRQSYKEKRRSLSRKLSEKKAKAAAGKA
mmetsp:Transcript_11750/g.23635  ORF Transcript_11750/g.23635 Transcript_11750/m.23635 type:complete len:253 (-) Transcript_11750:301-1059(-)|eukprot:CAMPEP_0167789592 /NCGR_PEP_ID=MMETSP0111_2-20121227/10785_1 /TAXON_ID=91324 /ORGANISM="Lotharella globosa, Strain CCCM811" /LENGTH=252 /DNA_ID=CAMNT_0007681805 /DNA_START=24 /DNA_END=782 /DNA_ORIENTATION=-